MIPQNIGFLGPKGTYSHQATLALFENESKYSLVPYSTISETLDSLGQSSDSVVIPFENSTYGLVQQTLDYFRSISPLYYATAQIYLPIHHCVLSTTTLDKVKRIFSHPEVFLF
jgi:prephenate dehydratase